MTKQDPCTTNLADFGSRERKHLIDLLTAWRGQGLPYDFNNEEVVPMFNRDSGFVFLTNADYQVCMMNGDNLETWRNCFNCNNEGFKEDCPLDEDGNCPNCSKKNDDEEE